MDLEGRLPIVINPPHLIWHPKGILEKELCRLGERRKWMRGYELISGHDEPHKLGGYMNARQECATPRAGQDRVCISYNETMPIYPGVFQIYTPCH